MMKRSLLFLAIITGLFAHAQDKYVYSVDLTKVSDDKLTISLTPPKITKSTIVYHFPRIIPGTYRIADYGKFVSDVKAFDKSGKSLQVKKLTDNTWQISSANTMARLEYKVDDIWDSNLSADVYPMAATNIEEGKNFVFNTPGFFGYFEGMNMIPFELRFTKPASFYAATPLKAASTSATQDIFVVDNLDHLYDSPIMFSVPDTTTVHLGNTEVLVAVYSPKKQVQSKFIAQIMKNMLNASMKYLGGRLPVDKYAFIFYFNSDVKPFSMPGALEHNYSSFYALPEAPQQQLAEGIRDIAAHEFFHIISPLTISSKEVKVFNFAQPVLSRHLWLYEGSTEYASDHAQVKYGLNTIPQFLNKLSGKIQISREQYNDTVPFTVMSQQVVSKYGEQFGNVYEKGALISAALDLLLLDLSDGAYDLVDLKHDLSVRFGKNRYFNDNELFDVIAELSYPETRDFFRKYVEGSTPIPYEQFFALAGVKYSPVVNRSDFTFGSVSIGPSQDGKVIVHDASQLNDFGKKMGYQRLDEIISFNDIRVTPSNYSAVMAKVKAEMKEGVPLKVKVARTKNSTEKDSIVLSAPAQKIQITEKHKLELMQDITEKQATVRRAWLAAEGRAVPVTVSMNDVSEIDNIIKALYDVISGPAGKRNWERFRSLFTANAFMGATVPGPGGSKFVTFTPEEYISMNAPGFLEDAFYEKELGRTVNQFGNIAQVFTSYEFDMGNGKLKQRGVNSVQLVREQGRWWIASIVWQDEMKDLPIPQALLNK